MLSIHPAPKNVAVIAYHGEIAKGYVPAVRHGGVVDVADT